MLVHGESASRGHFQPDTDMQLFSALWAEEITRGDPFLSPHLDQDSLTYQILRPRFRV